MESIPVIHAAILMPFIKQALTTGDWAKEELLAVGLPQSLATQGSAVIPLVPALRFVQISARRQNLNTLGLMVGATTSIRDLGPMGTCLDGCQTLEQALTRVEQNIHFITTIRQISLEKSGSSAVVTQRLATRMLPGHEQVEQYALMLLINLIREAAGPSWLPDCVILPKSVTDLIGFHANILTGTTIEKGEAVSFAFDLSLLSQGIGAITVLGEHYHRPTRDTLGGPLPTNLRETIEIAMETNVRAERVGLSSFAELTGQSPRTLQRTLERLGLTFSDLSAQARLKFAQELLAGSTTSIVTIANELGYSDAAAFTKAFKRWAGCTPSEYRGRRAEDTVVPKKQ